MSHVSLACYLLETFGLVPCHHRIGPNSPKWLLNCKNLYTGSENMEMYFSLSADVYSDLTIRLALKNYPKMTPDTLISGHLIGSYGDAFFHVSCCVKWPYHWISLKKLPQNDPWHFEICQLDQILWKWLFHVICCVVTLPLDWLRKTTLKWPLKHWNLFNRLEVMEMSFSMSADVYSDLIIGLAIKNYPKMTLQLPKSIHWI